jgi:spermidine/putrescine transport system permease protein
MSEALAPSSTRIGRISRLSSVDWSKHALTLGVLAIYVFLYLPAIVIALFSFDHDALMSWPPSHFGLHWYRTAVHDSDLTTALKNSIVVALASVALALVLGVPAAFGLDRFQFPGKAIFQRVLILPFLLPGIISGITLLTFFLDLHFTLSLMTIVVAHATMLLSIVVIQMSVALHRWNRSLESAAMDLGANELRVFFHVILPNFRSAILGAALLGITVSLDEVARTFFVTGQANTLPIVILSMLHRIVTPEINAIGTLILGISFVAIAVWSRVAARSVARRRR